MIAVEGSEVKTLPEFAMSDKHGGLMLDLLAFANANKYNLPKKVTGSYSVLEKPDVPLLRVTGWYDGLIWVEELLSECRHLGFIIEENENGRFIHYQAYALPYVKAMTKERQGYPIIKARELRVVNVTISITNSVIDMQPDLYMPRHLTRPIMTKEMVDSLIELDGLCLREANDKYIQRWHCQLNGEEVKWVPVWLNHIRGDRDGAGLWCRDLNPEFSFERWNAFKEKYTS